MVKVLKFNLCESVKYKISQSLPHVDLIGVHFVFAPDTRVTVLVVKVTIITVNPKTGIKP